MGGTIAALLMSAILATAQTPGESFESLSRQAEAARDGQHLDAAVEFYRRALKLKPAWDEGWWNLGSIAYDQDKYSECATAFQRLTALKADSAPGWTMLGLCD